MGTSLEEKLETEGVVLESTTKGRKRIPSNLPETYGKNSSLEEV